MNSTFCALTAGGEAPHAFVVLKEGARADERELCEFPRANTPCGAPVDRPQSRWGSGERSGDHESISRTSSRCTA